MIDKSEDFTHTKALFHAFYYTIIFLVSLEQFFLSFLPYFFVFCSCVFSVECVLVL